MALNTDLTLLATVGAINGVDGTDASLPRYISAASDAVRRYLHRSSDGLAYQSAFVETLPGHGTYRLVLGLTPLITIGSVALPDGSVLASTEYAIEDADFGFLRRDSGWPSTASVLPGIVQRDPVPGTEKRSIIVTYAGGWVTPAQFASIAWAGPARSLPFDIEEATIQTVVELYRRGGDAKGISSERLGDYAVGYFPGALEHAIPGTARALLDGYRRLHG